MKRVDSRRVPAGFPLNCGALVPVIRRVRALAARQRSRTSPKDAEVSAMHCPACQRLCIDVAYTDLVRPRDSLLIATRPGHRLILAALPSVHADDSSSRQAEPAWTAHPERSTPWSSVRYPRTVTSSSGRKPAKALSCTSCTPLLVPTNTSFMGVTKRSRTPRRSQREMACGPGSSVANLTSCSWGSHDEGRP
jgi:hypothetical protein